MKIKQYVNMAALLALTVLSASCSDPSAGGAKTYPEYRYKLTVEVDTPEGTRSGSSVIAVRSSVASMRALNPGYLTTRVRGEAVTVDLGARGVMFALLRSAYSVDWANGALMGATKPVTYAESKAAGLTKDFDPAFGISMQRVMALKGRYDVPRIIDTELTRSRLRNQGEALPSGYPMLVHFKDMADPKSVEQVNEDHLDKAFGKGVKLNRITVERTEEPVTTGIYKRLGWLPKRQGSLTQQPRDPVTKQLVPVGQTSLSVQLTDADFQRNN